MRSFDRCDALVVVEIDASSSRCHRLGTSLLQTFVQALAKFRSPGTSATMYNISDVSKTVTLNIVRTACPSSVRM